MRMLRLLAAALLLTAACGCEKQEAAPDTTVKPTKVSATPEYQLALQNARGYVPENDPAVTQFRTVLSSLDAKYPEDAQKIANLSIEGRSSLESTSANQTLLQMMQSIDKAGGTHKDYASAVKAYVARFSPR